MEHKLNLESLLYQVMTGRTRCVVMDTPYYVCPPSPAQRLEASFIYDNTIYECSFQGILTNEQMLEVMIDNNLWSMEEETELNSAPTRMDALKVEMYSKHAAFQSRRVEQARRMLERLRRRVDDLSARRHMYDLYTCSGLATTMQMQYLISCNTRNVAGELIDLESQADWLCTNILETYIRNRPSEQSLRDLSKYGKWRMMWASGHTEHSVFGVPSTWLTEEQQNLIAWSKLYDNVGEHPEPPSKEVLDDDDMLDGWVILQQRKREKEQRERDGGKHGGAQEVFIPAETAEDAKRIEGMNEAGAAFAKRQRMALLQKQGTVKEQHMPDSKQQISVQAATEFRERMQQARRKR